VKLIAVAVAIGISSSAVKNAMADIATPQPRSNCQPARSTRNPARPSRRASTAPSPIMPAT
jgi:hypothetical protein